MSKWSILCLEFLRRLVFWKKIANFPEIIAVMLVKLVIENFFSYGNSMELDMVADRQIQSMRNHIHHQNGIDLIKLAGLYGANGVGKSNFIKGVDYLKKLVTDDEMPDCYKDSLFRSAEDKRQLFIVVYIQNGTWFRYSVEIKDHKIKREVLMLVGPMREEYSSLFERTFDDGKTRIKFSDELEKGGKCKGVRGKLLSNDLQEDKPIFKLLAELPDEHFREIKVAYQWFEESLQVMQAGETANPDITDRLERSGAFKDFVEKFMSSIDLGISGLKVEKWNMDDYFDQVKPDFRRALIGRVEASVNKMINLNMGEGDVLIVKEGGGYVVKKLLFEHRGRNMLRFFTMEEESYGSGRLLAFARSLYGILFEGKVVFIDELDSNIHPLLMKKLIQIVLLANGSKGQLIFTAHKTILPEENIIRPDALWIVEKDDEKASDISPLSKYRGGNVSVNGSFLKRNYGQLSNSINVSRLKGMFSGNFIRNWIFA